MRLEKVIHAVTDRYHDQYDENCLENRREDPDEREHQPQGE